MDMAVRKNLLKNTSFIQEKIIDKLRKSCIFTS